VEKYFDISYPVLDKDLIARSDIPLFTRLISEDSFRFLFFLTVLARVVRRNNALITCCTGNDPAPIPRVINQSRAFSPPSAHENAVPPN